MDKKLEELRNFINEEIREEMYFLGQELYFSWLSAVEYTEDKITFERTNKDFKNVEKVIDALDELFKIFEKINEIDAKAEKEKSK